MAQYASYSGYGGSGGGGGGGVTSVNGATGPSVTIVGGTGIAVGTLGNTITVSNTETAFTAANLTDVGTDGIVITNGTNAVNGSGTSIAQTKSDATHNGYLSSIDWSAFNSKGLGSVTSVSVVSANGLAGTVLNPTTTPAITLSTSITGILQGNGTAISAATTGNLTDVGTDGIVITNGTGSVLGTGTSLAQHVADTTHNGYLSSIDWSTFNNKQSSLTLGNLTDVGTDGIVITNGSGAVVGTGTSIAQHVSDTTHNGYLSSIDWTTFNSKQPAGSYITALTGDVTASGPGSAVASLVATTNSTLTTLSSLSLPGAQVSGNISGNAGNVTGVVAIANGGTGQTSANPAFNALSPLTTAGDLLFENSTPVNARLPIGTTGQFLQVVGGLPAWSSATPGSIAAAYLREEQPLGTNGGTFTSGAFVVRTLNTITDPSSIILSFSANQFSLGAGTYLISAFVPSFTVDRVQAWLQNITDALTTLWGGSGFAASSTNGSYNSSIQGVFSIAATKTFEIHQQCQTTATTAGLGVADSIGTEVYTQVTITKLA